MGPVGIIYNLQLQIVGWILGAEYAMGNLKAHAYQNYTQRLHKHTFSKDQLACSLYCTVANDTSPSWFLPSSHREVCRITSMHVNLIILVMPLTNWAE